MFHLVDRGASLTRDDIEDLWNQCNTDEEKRQILNAEFNGEHAFTQAARQGAYEAVAWLIEKWSSSELSTEEQNMYKKYIDKPDADGHTPLFEACRQCFIGSDNIMKSEKKKANRLRIVELLIENEARVNIRSKHVGMTPLHWAAYNNDSNVVKLLIEKNAP